MNTLSKFFTDTLTNLVYPQYCCNCKRLGNYLCDACLEQVEYLWQQPDHLSTADTLTSLTASCDFLPPISSCIIALKYQSVQPLGKFLGEQLFLHCTLPQAEAVTFVPLHPIRQRQRGYNQSELIAIRLGELMNIPVHPLLVRTLHQARQASVHTKHERLQRLQHSFQLNPNLTSPLPSSVLLIDDVVTTGATLSECARILREAGVSQVHAVAVAHKS